MQDSLTDLLFAEDLMKFLMKGREVDWYPEGGVSRVRDVLPLSPFKEVIGFAVIAIMDRYWKDIRSCYEEIDFMCYRVQNGLAFTDKGIFRDIAIRAASHYFPKEYTHEAFLGYCAIVLGVAYNFYCQNSDGIRECATQVVALVLTSHKLTGQFNKQGGWDGLHQTSDSFCKCEYDGYSREQIRGAV